MRVAWLVLAGCAAPVASATQAVTNGSADIVDPAVVALIGSDGSVLCTASVISDHTGITAAHCFSGPPARTLRIFFGNEVGNAGGFFAVSDAKQHPAFDLNTFANDVAMFTFRGGTPVAPLALDTRTIDASLVGTTFDAVGFGTTGSAPDTGIKRAGVAQISDVGAAQITTVPDPSQPCEGDSGGPMLLSPDAVAAVVSHGDVACTDHAVYQRIDVVRAAFVDPYIAATAPGTAHVGDACFYDAQCAEGPCLQTEDDPLLYFCSQPCTTASDCPAAMKCTANFCRYREPSPGALGAVCASGSDCSSTTCIDQVCTISCLGQACPAGYECRGQDLSQYCFAPAGGCGGCASGGEGLPIWLIVGWLWYAASRQRNTSRTD